SNQGTARRHHVNMNLKPIACTLLLGTTLIGCGGKAPPPPRAEAPPPGYGPVRYRDPARPVVSAEYDIDDRPFDDVPIISQRPPEQRAFVDAYNAVGRPRITLFVNRTLEGHLIPTVEHEPIVAVERTRRATTAVTAEQRDQVRYEDY